MTLNTSSTEYEKSYNYFVERLKQARKEAGLTQLEVADRLETTQTYISKYERGALRLDIIQLLDFAKLYGKPITYFVEGIE